MFDLCLDSSAVRCKLSGVQVDRSQKNWTCRRAVGWEIVLENIACAVDHVDDPVVSVFQMRKTHGTSSVHGRIRVDSLPKTTFRLKCRCSLQGGDPRCASLSHLRHNNFVMCVHVAGTTDTNSVCDGPQLCVHSRRFSFQPCFSLATLHRSFTHGQRSGTQSSFVRLHDRFFFFLVIFFRPRSHVCSTSPRDAWTPAADRAHRPGHCRRD